MEEYSIKLTDVLLINEAFPNKVSDQYGWIFVLIVLVNMGMSQERCFPPYFEFYYLIANERF